MRSTDTDRALERVVAARRPDRGDLEHLLTLEKRSEMQKIFDCADRVRRGEAGNGILLRGIVEFSNFCRNRCRYCGLNRDNLRLERYRLSAEEILSAVERIAAVGIKTVVLQSGEDERLDPVWLADVVGTIKRKYDIAVTLSVGEREKREYAFWKDAGADRYLLKIETTDARLYERLHPGMDYADRLRCLKDLKELGYQTGSGGLVGLPGQSPASIADDILFYTEHNFDMIGIGAFLPHQNTDLGAFPPGKAQLALKTLALTRIATRNAHLPAATSLDCVNVREQALQAGANVVMPVFTPLKFGSHYEIYPQKISGIIGADESMEKVQAIARKIGRELDYSTGHSLKVENGFLT